MNVIKILKDNSEFFIALMALLPSLMGFIFKQFSYYFEKIEKEKIIKKSILSKIIEDRINYTLIQLFLFIPVIIIAAFIIEIICFYLKLKSPSPNSLTAFGYIIYLILSELLVKKIKHNRRLFLENIVTSKLKNIILFYSTSFILNLSIFIIIFFEVSANLQLNVTLILIVIVPTVGSLKYFNATVQYDRYSFVQLYFNNSYPVVCCGYKNFNINENSFVTVSHINGGNELIKFNNNIISKIDFISNDKFEEDYKVYLSKRGFIL
ncbi:hypothetical protein [Anaerocolumna jejuensis]|uniref:hypothetical protein n=1 Tax=Anaerocolumna jejuensis TaxID=259063 RepID=UPI003F7B6216